MQAPHLCVKLLAPMGRSDDDGKEQASEYRAHAE
jgi:hypothetical protein